MLYKITTHTWENGSPTNLVTYPKEHVTYVTKQEFNRTNISYASWRFE